MIPGAAWILVVVAMVVPVFFVLMWVMGGYNRLVTLRKRYIEAYAQLDNRLRRRYELIDGLVETAKGYIPNEPGIFEAVLAARNAASAANALAKQVPGDTAAMKDLCGAEQALAGTIGRLLGVVDAHPDLKGDNSMKRLLEELTAIENTVALASRTFNDAVKHYNLSRETFPTSIIARPLSFGPAESFEITQAGGVTSNGHQ
jgi:LemA protein